MYWIKREIRNNCISIVTPLIILSTVALYKTYESFKDLDNQWNAPIQLRRVTSVQDTNRHATPSTVTHKPTMVAHDFTVVSALQSQRKTLMNRVCSTDKKLRTSRTSWTYKLNVKDKYLFCPIPKAGWSSWKWLWFYTSGVIDSYDIDVGVSDDKLAMVRDVKGEKLVEKETKKHSNNYAFTFVRNPWERLVSAYINKAVDSNYSRILHSPCKEEFMHPYKSDLTFTQFLSCIIKSGARDMHWRPQWLLCNVCRVKFDFIGHLETVDEDAAYVLSKVGVKAKYPHSFASKKYSTKDVMEKWYREIPKDLLSKLITIYKFDFELHGYSKQPPGRPDVVGK